MSNPPPGVLTRLVVFAPRRRLELALPCQAPVSYLLPGLLRHAGEQLAETGLAHQGWVLRRADGSLLEPGSSFADQSVHDGDQLHLVPRELAWPEPQYDDIVEAVAAGSRQQGARWAGGATRAAGLAGAGVALSVGLATAAAAGPPWPVTAGVALATAGVLLVVGAVLARALADAAGGAAVAAAAMPYAFLGGLIVFADEPLGRLGAPHLLTGSALLATAGLVAHLAAAAGARWCVAGISAGGSGVVGAGAAVLFAGLGGAGAAALLVSMVLLFAPLTPTIAVRLGRIPLPALPRTPADLVADPPPPDRRSVDAAIGRTDEILTGALVGLAVASAGCFALLAVDGRPTALALATVVSVALLLRARFHAAVRHRLPLLAAGGLGLALVGVSLGIAGGTDRVTITLAVTLAAALSAVAAGLAYQRRAPGPRLGRYADALDVLLTLAVVPLAADVFGLYGYLRALGG